MVARLGLFGRLGASARVTVVSAPPGSGKTVLLRSWIGEAGLAERAAWVPAGREERDPQRFWLSVLSALGQTTPGSKLVRPVTGAPDLDGWAITERLLKDLAPLDERLWLVIDDVHELGSDQALRQLELLLMRAPPQLRFLLATRHDVPLGLHRLRLEGELTEIRTADLRFTTAEARELFDAAGVKLPEPAVVMLHERTEGWAAGLRLAALSLAGHPDPERFAAEFAGSERTVAEYLVAEVLERHSEPVRQLLLRTSLLERVNGELADALTGSSGGEGILQELEEANAFVVSLDAARSWFRYHRLFADLLQLRLRRTALGLRSPRCTRRPQGGTPGMGTQWRRSATHRPRGTGSWPPGYSPTHAPSLYLDGQAATVHALLAGFPAETRAADAELAALVAADELAQGSLAEAERYLGLAERGSASMPAGRRGQLRVLLGVVRLLLAQQHGHLPAVAEEARRLQDLAEAPDAVQPGLDEELHALALTSLGIAEVWAGRFEEAEPHLEQGVALARRIGRPYLEFRGLAHQVTIEIYRSSYARAEEHGRQAIELAEQHGWTDDPAAGTAYVMLATVLVWLGRPGEAEPWVERAERTVRAEADPAPALAVCYVRGTLELARGRDGDALTAFRAAERQAGHLVAPHYLVPLTRAMLVHALVRLGELEQAEQVLGGLDAQDRDRGETHIVASVLRLAQGDPRTATAVLAPVLDGSAPLIRPGWLVEGFLLEAIARDELGDPVAAERALERALDIAGPSGAVLIFLLHPVPGLLERHARHRTAHASLIGEILSVLTGKVPASPPIGSQPPLEPLSNSEIRVLRYLPTNLSGPEIANELSISPNTVKTHIHNLYMKLGTHRRGEAVARARAVGLLAPSAPRR